MVDYKEILRLSDQGCSQRQIVAIVGSSHTMPRSEAMRNAKLKESDSGAKLSGK